MLLSAPLIAFARALALKEAGVPSRRFCLRTEAGRVVRVAPVCLNRRWNEWQPLEGRFYAGVPEGLRAVACTLNGRGRVVLLLVEHEEKTPDVLPTSTACGMVTA